MQWFYYKCVTWNAAEIIKLFKDVNPYLDIITNSSKQISDRQFLDDDIIKELLKSEKEFLPLMNEIVATYEKENNGKIGTLKIVIVVVGILLLLIIISALIFIIIPSIIKGQENEDSLSVLVETRK